MYLEVVGWGLYSGGLNSKFYGMLIQLHCTERLVTSYDIYRAFFLQYN